MIKIKIPKNKKIQLEVGKWYITRDGLMITKIVHKAKESDNMVFCFFDSTWMYRKDGRIRMDKIDDGDLVAEVKVEEES